MHYDWGLRAVKSVLVVAGGFKRMEPDLQEEALLMRALRDFNVPKIVREDSVVFFGLLGDLFPGIDPPRKIDDALEKNVLEACAQLGNDPDELFRLKIVQLEELLEIRHCVFVMGPPGAGKSQCWKTLAQARTIRGDKTKCTDINPKSVKTEELYGFISMATREWRDGLLSKVMRELGEIPDEKPKWIIMDGDLDANWIEVRIYPYIPYIYINIYIIHTSIHTYMHLLTNIQYPIFTKHTHTHTKNKHSYTLTTITITTT